MIVPPGRIITVHIVTFVVLVFGIQSLDAHAIFLHQNVLNILDTDSTMFFLEEIWGISHSNAEVGTQLVVSEAMSGFKDILINASSVNVFSVNHILRILLWFHRDPVAPLEVHLNPVGPLLVCPLLRIPAAIFHLNVRSLNEVVIIELLHESQARVKQGCQFDGGPISWCRWDTLVPCLIRGPHLVHPSTAVKLVTSMNEAGIPVEPDVDIEALIAHLAVDLRTSIKLPKLDAIRMGLKYLVHDVQKR